MDCKELKEEEKERHHDENENVHVTREALEEHGELSSDTGIPQLPLPQK